MNKLLSLALLLMPLMSFGQKIEVTEMGGMSYNKAASTNFFYGTHGFSNQVGVNYYFTKYLSAGAYHELNAWSPNCHAFGLAADGHFRNFSIGVNAGKMYIDARTTTFYGDIYYAPNGTMPNFSPVSLTFKLNPALLLGAHASMDEQLYRHFFLKEQIAYNYATTKGTEFGDQYAMKMYYVSALVGVGFRF